MLGHPLDMALRAAGLLIGSKQLFVLCLVVVSVWPTNKEEMYDNFFTLRSQSSNKKFVIGKSRADNEFVHEYLNFMTSKYPDVYIPLAISCILLGSLGNLAFFAIFGNKSKRVFYTRDSVYFRLLSTIDLLVCVIVIPYSMFFETQRVDNNYACKIMEYIRHFLTYTSHLALIAYSYELPLRLGYTASKEHVRRALYAVIMISTVCSIPSIFLFKVERNAAGNMTAIPHIFEKLREDEDFSLKAVYESLEPRFCHLTFNFDPSGRFYHYIEYTKKLYFTINAALYGGGLLFYVYKVIMYIDARPYLGRDSIFIAPVNKVALSKDSLRPLSPPKIEKRKLSAFPAYVLADEDDQVVRMNRTNDSANWYQRKNQIQKEGTELDSALNSPDVKASGNSNNASGNRNNASGNDSKTSGTGNKVSGNGNKASGNRNKASRNRNKASGNINKASEISNNASRSRKNATRNRNTSSGNGNRASGTGNNTSEISTWDTDRNVVTANINNASETGMRRGNRVSFGDAKVDPAGYNFDATDDGQGSKQAPLQRSILKSPEKPFLRISSYKKTFMFLIFLDILIITFSVIASTAVKNSSTILNCIHLKSVFSVYLISVTNRDLRAATWGRYIPGCNRCQARRRGRSHSSGPEFFGSNIRPELMRAWRRSSYQNSEDDASSFVSGVSDIPVPVRMLDPEADQDVSPK